MKQCIETHGIDIERAFLAETPEEFHEYFTKRLFNYENVNLMSMFKYKQCNNIHAYTIYTLYKCQFCA